jgi:co-chaperonin GroES (HSP10)
MIEPLRDLVYIIPIYPKERGGIITSPAHDHRPHQGIIKYRGPQTTGEVRVGDHVFFHGWEGIVLVHEDEGHLVVVREMDIHAKEAGEGREPVLTLSQFHRLFDVALLNYLRGYVQTDAMKAHLVDAMDRVKEEAEGLIEQELYF